MKYYLVNVFTRDEKAGNQLAVVFPKHPISTEHMQSIAREFNFSETVFVDQKNNLRIFTPKSELPFAGHPTVGAAWTLFHHEKLSNDFEMMLSKGKISAHAYLEGARIIFPGEATHQDFEGDLADALQHCHVLGKDVIKEKVRLINVGPEFLLIPLVSREALINARSPVHYETPLKFYFVYQESRDIFYVRMFAPVLSVDEDAATGSAACALAHFLKSVEGHQAGRAIVYQGQEMSRPCEIHIEWGESIHLGGKVKLWASGELSL